jgi:hypothetical protein
MNQPVVSALEPIILGAVNVALVEGAARALEGFSEEILTSHSGLARPATPSSPPP